MVEASCQPLGVFCTSILMAGKKAWSGMAENKQNKGLVNVVICNGGVIC